MSVVSAVSINERGVISVHSGWHGLHHCFPLPSFLDCCQSLFRACSVVFGCVLGIVVALLALASVHNPAACQDNCSLSTGMHPVAAYGSVAALLLYVGCYQVATLHLCFIGASMVLQHCFNDA
jgi:hypothetical protein